MMATYRIAEWCRGDPRAEGGSLGARARGARFCHMNRSFMHLGSSRRSSQHQRRRRDWRETRNLPLADVRKPKLCPRSPPRSAAPLDPHVRFAGTGFGGGWQEAADDSDFNRVASSKRIAMP